MFSKSRANNKSKNKTIYVQPVVYFITLVRVIYGSYNIFRGHEVIPKETSYTCETIEQEHCSLNLRHSDLPLNLNRNFTSTY